MVTLRIRKALVASAALVLSAGTGLALLPATGAVALAGSSASQAAVASSATVRPASLGTASYAFSSVLDGKPVRWNPCAPILWTSNTTRGPAGGLAVLTSSVARIAALTGTTWKYVGATTRVPTAGYLPKAASATYPPVLIGWADATSSDLLRGQAKGVLAMTRTSWFGVQTPAGAKIAATRAAVVALDRTDVLPLRGGTSWNAVVLHELGHAMGLAHTGDARQLMATLLPRTVADLQAGDKAGLVKLGRTPGCVTVPAM
ncbi:MAG: peptidase and matrixin and adamalysin [Frankiales bacterium]|nr:peptidase and matrixin and adamalysin [Frankiales bacterium]